MDRTYNLTGGSLSVAVYSNSIGEISYLIIPSDRLLVYDKGNCDWIGSVQKHH